MGEIGYLIIEGNKDGEHETAGLKCWNDVTTSVLNYYSITRLFWKG